MNRYTPHLYIIPEDDRDRQIADGFVLHDRVKSQRIQVMPPAGGWREVLKTFTKEYIARLREYDLCHIVLLIDFDGRYVERRVEFENAVPESLKPRVFVLGPKQAPEDLTKLLGKNYEQIGWALADDCFSRTEASWSHEHLKHNDPDRLRLLNVAESILFER